MIIYCRISDDREGRRAGVERQEKDCRHRAEKLGWEVVAVLVDNDISAYSGKPRPEYQKMLGLLRAGGADAVLALTTRRLQRNWRDAFEFLDLVEEHDIAVATVKGGTVDLSTADGRREARRKAVDDQHESEEISERVRDAKAETLANGQYRGGPRPFGYEADGTTLKSLLCPRCGTGSGFSADRQCGGCGADAVNAHGSEAWHIEQATLALIGGDSLRSVCRDWARQGVRTVPRRYRREDGTRGEPESRAWRPEELRKLLLRPRNAGLIEHRGEVVGRAAWAPIVAEDKWRACKAVLDDPARRTTTSNARKWLGSGLYRCGMPVCPAEQRLGVDHVCTEECVMSRCGLTVRCSTSGTAGHAHMSAYRCWSGKHVTRKAAPLDAFIEELIVRRLSMPDAVSLLQDDSETVDVAAAEQDLMAAKRSIRVAAELLGAGDMDADAYRAATAKAREREKRARGLLTLAARSNPLVDLVSAGDVEAEWKRIEDLGRKRAVLDTLMEVWLLPARRGRLPGGARLDLSAVDVRWRRPLTTA